VSSSALIDPLDSTQAQEAGSGRSPGRAAWAQLLRNRVAVGAASFVLLIVAACLAAPLYAHLVAHTNPFVSAVNGTTVVNGKTVPVFTQSSSGLGLGTTPIGPTWDIHHYFLGADGQGRDVMARLLYGGRTSLLIGISSALICCAIATVLGLLAGYFGGVLDGILSRAFDIVWAFPVYLLAICLSIVLVTNGLTVGPISIDSGSLLLPIGIISIIYVPYVARPIRAQVISLRRREFVQSAISVGASDARIMRRDILPNVMPTVIVFLPLMAALNMLIESALSFLGVGVQPPGASWGTIINDGLALLYTRPLVTVVPGLLIAVAAGALNLVGDGIRDALDPNSRMRGDR
jgi:peptide/nickel transport system permease protein